ncbi:MAG: hypothetical protein H6842_05330 [Rhodospirillaceae bacterium]|nr:hypothetical protein [Rhodospirillaceae bacterium]
MRRPGQPARTKQQPITGLPALAAELLDIGKPHDLVVGKLMEYGVERQEAAAIVAGVAGSQTQAQDGNAPALSQVGPKHMLFGLVFFGVGLFIALAKTYLTSAAEVQLIAYGAMFAGATEFAYGLVRQVNG